jgi:uracil-DNA glycosylase
MIYTVDPILVMAVGKVSASTLLGHSVAVTKEHEKIFQIPMTGRHGVYHQPVMTVVHPAALARENDFGPNSQGEKTYDDFVQMTHIRYKFREFHYEEPIPRNLPTYSNGLMRRMK